MQDPDQNDLSIVSPVIENGGGDKINPGDTPQEVPAQQPDEVPPDQVGSD